MEKARDHLILLGQAIFVVCVALILANFKPVEREYSMLPVKGDKGDTGVVDYEKVGEIVQTQIAVLPKPQDGKNGQNGTNGTDGKDAEPVDYAAIQAFVQQKVQEAFDAQKNTPQPELDIEYGNGKWRLVGDDSWQVCTPQDNCP